MENQLAFTIRILVIHRIVRINDYLRIHITNRLQVSNIVRQSIHIRHIGDPCSQGPKPRPLHFFPEIAF